MHSIYDKVCNNVYLTSICLPVYNMSFPIWSATVEPKQIKFPTVPEHILYISSAQYQTEGRHTIFIDITVINGHGTMDWFKVGKGLH